MIVRQHKEGLSRKYLFNIAGGGLLAIAAVFALKMSFLKDDTPLCEARYSGGVLFSLARRGGEPLGTSDLQSRLGGSDWGIGDNARVVEDKDAPTGYALQVDLRREPSVNGGQSGRRSGVGFTWMPHTLERARAACLTYYVAAAPEFHAGLGGRLPAIVGGKSDRVTGSGIAEGKGFAVNMAWRSDLALDVVSQQVDDDKRRPTALDYGKLKLRPGAWVRIDQEVVLNDPKQRDGILRVWVDGKLRLERTDMRFRDAGDQRFLGLQADTYNTRTGLDWQPSMKDTWLRMSPFELRLQ
jgi:hypothetical protein